MIIKSFHSTALAASILGLCAFSQDASAATVSITSQAFTGSAPLEVTPAPASTSGSFSQSVSGSIFAVELSPYAANTGSGPDGSAAAANATYSVLGAGGGPVSTATYNVNSTSLTLLWGSPDPYNEIAFFTGPNGTGSLIDVIGGNTTNYNGSNLSCFASTCTDTLFDLVTFAVSSGTIGSIILTDAGAAFEFGFSAATPVDPTPLPAGLPLFATGIGALGLLGWRRKRKSRAASVL
jgi:hypothetical protein